MTWIKQTYLTCTMSVLTIHTTIPNSARVNPGWVHHDTENRTKVPGHHPLLKQHPPPPLNIPLALLKSHVHPKIVRGLIISFRESFTTLMLAILVLCITKNSRNYWRNSHKITHFFIPSGIISWSNSRLTTLHITKRSITCGITDV